jgi:hypothetical protein
MTMSATFTPAFEVLFTTIEERLPPRHKVWIQGPNLDGSWTVNIIENLTPSASVWSSRGRLDVALWETSQFLLDYEPIRGT